MKIEQKSINFDGPGRFGSISIKCTNSRFWCWSLTAIREWGQWNRNYSTRPKVDRNPGKAASGEVCALGAHDGFPTAEPATAQRGHFLDRAPQAFGHFFHHLTGQASSPYQKACKNSNTN